MMEYVKTCFKKYVVFDGRARRAEFWWFWVFNVAVSRLLTMLDKHVLHSEWEVTSGIWTLVVLLPFLAVGARRLHDTNRSALWLFLWLLPVVGWIWIIVLYVLPGKPGANQYGPDPKDPNALPPSGVITY